MNKYEIAIALNPNLDEEACNKAIEDVKALVTRFGGNVIDVDAWGKKELAYEIQNFKEAYYYFVHFESNPEAPKDIESRLRIMDNCLRYLVVSMDK